MSDLTTPLKGDTMVAPSEGTMSKEFYLCICQRCKTKWASRNIIDYGKKPKRCPKCKSPYWDKPLTNHNHKEK